MANMALVQVRPRGPFGYTEAAERVSGGAWRGQNHAARFAFFDPHATQIGDAPVLTFGQGTGE